MRDQLADKVAVVIDERDQRDLDDREAENDEEYAEPTTVEHVRVSRRVSEALTLLFFLCARD